MSFAEKIHEIETRFAAAAAVDGDVYLPNFTPKGQVDAVVVGMEPSLGRWAQTPAEAADRIAAGFRNFMWSPEDFILHYAVRRFLLSLNQTYHITDTSKGAMTVRKAHVDRRARYERWFPLLDEEIRLVAKPEAWIIAVGGQVCRLLRRRLSDRRVACVVHYAAWANALDAGMRGKAVEFRAFSDALSMQHIVDVAKDVMQENSISAELCAETLNRLRKARLTESRKKLAFIYATRLAELRHDKTASATCHH